MSTAATWPLGMMLLLGAWHGINPGMGWLFAVALGLQEQERRAVWRTLLPLAAGHALAIALTLCLMLVLGTIVPQRVLRLALALVLVGFGLRRLTQGKHLRYGGMCMNLRQLTLWSFLMASAHGAGLMVLPFAMHSATRKTAAPSPPGVAAVGTSGIAAAHPGRARHAAHVSPDNPAPAAQNGVNGSGALEVRELRTPVPGGAGHGTHLARPGGDAGAGSTGTLVLLLHTLGYLAATGVIATVVYERLGLRRLRALWLNLDLVWGGALILTGMVTLAL